MAAPTALELAASRYLKASDALGRHLKNCLHCKGDSPSVNCSAGLDVFRARSSAYSEMSTEAFKKGLR